MIKDDRRVATIYKNDRKRKVMHKVEESFGRKYICGPRTGNLWFQIKAEHENHYEVYVSEL